jgi:hypothetical protein
MDGQDLETAGKRKTKNSTSLAEGEKELAKAKKESKRQAKREQKLKEKEEKSLEYALSLSSLEARMNGTLLINEQEAYRKEEAAHLLNVHASSSIESTPLLLLGSVASSSTATFARISQGKEEVDPNDQVLDRDDFSPFSSFDEDSKRESSDSLPLVNNTSDLTLDASSDEVMSTAVEAPSQLQASPEVSDEVKQRHLMEMDVQCNVDNAMANFVKEDLKDLNVEIKSERRDDCSSNTSDHIKWGESVELNSQSSRSQRSSRSGSSNNSNISFTKEMYTQLMASSEKWTSEEDVILDMRSLSCTDKVSIRPEVIAGIVFDSRPAVCDVSQLIRAQARNFEKAHKELASDLSKIKQVETRKIQHARRILEKKMEECDGKSRELDSRIKATAIFGDVHESFASLEHALEESHSDNRSLRDRVKVLESTLKDMVSNGITHSSLKGKGIVTRIKTEPSSSSSNPAKSPHPSSGYNSASSATSIPTSHTLSPRVDSPMAGLEVYRNKRELSPASKYKDEDFVFKKPKSHQTPWAKWNSNGIEEADDFIKTKGKYAIQSKSVDDLNYFRIRVKEALDDFKNLFPKDLPPDECVQRKDSETHESYHNLRLDLGIPHEDGRTCSVHFYYGKVLGCINNTLSKRASFRKHHSDNWKINNFINHLGLDSQTVSQFLKNEKHLRMMDERAPCVIQEFEVAYSNLCQPNAEQPHWLHRSTFKNIRDNVRERIPMPMSNRDALYNDCLKQFNNFFYNIQLHEVIDFYNRARDFATQQSNKGNGGGPQARS